MVHHLLAFVEHDAAQVEVHRLEFGIFLCLPSNDAEESWLYGFREHFPGGDHSPVASYAELPEFRSVIFREVDSLSFFEFYCHNQYWFSCFLEFALIVLHLI